MLLIAPVKVLNLNMMIGKGFTKEVLDIISMLS
jgi:hypothetical protein